MNARDEFFLNIRHALGRPEGTPDVVSSETTHLSQDKEMVGRRARSILQDMEERADQLLSDLAESASRAGWKVTRVESAREAAQYVETLARDLEVGTLVRSAHPMVNRLNLEEVLLEAGVRVDLMAMEETADEENRDEQRRTLRERAIQADVGVTGVNYAIAETGTCVLLAGKGTSRLVSLLPPVHVAVVERGQVLPSLDELFTLRRQDFLDGNMQSYMNLITGPSRSADIEYTLVTGVHGPGEVHLVLVG